MTEKRVWDPEDRKKWDETKEMVVDKEPFFAYLAYFLDEVVSWDFPTLATDGRRMIVNPDFLKGKSRYRQAFYRCHEIGHVALKHCLRRATDWKHWRQDLFLQATDYVVNLWLRESLDWIPANVWDEVLAEGCLLDDRFKGMTTEQVYRILEQEQPQQGCPVHGPGNGAQSPSSASGGGGGTQGTSKKKKPNSGAQKGSGGQQAQGCGCGDGGCVQPMPGASGGKISEAEVEAAEQELGERILQAAKVAKARGRVPGGVDRLIDEIIHPKEDPLDMLRRLFAGSLPTDFTWERPNKKHIHRGLYLPSIQKTGIGRVAFAVDTSGSMHPDELKLAWGVVAEVCASKHPEKLWLVFCDAEVHAEEIEVTDTPEFNAKGGGGTDFDPVFKWAETQELDVLVYFTDLVCPAQHLAAPDYPVIWVSCRPLKEANKEWLPTFGHFVEVEPGR